jgi:hypothetical protein
MTSTPHPEPENPLDADTRIVPPTLDELLALGRPVIPCSGPKKEPIVRWKPYQRRLPTPGEMAAWRKLDPDRWAMVTGAISGIVTLDFDGGPGRDRLRELGISPHRSTPSGGFHADFRHPGWYIKSLNAKSSKALAARYPGLDIRADGGYACVLITVPDAGEYRWLRAPEPYPLDVLPAAMLEFFGLDHAPRPKAKQAAAANPAHDFPVNLERWISKALEVAASQGRNNAGMWLACQLRDDGVDISTAEAALASYAARTSETNTKGQREAYTEQEALATVRSAYGRPARSPAQGAGNAGSTGSRAGSSPPSGAAPTDDEAAKAGPSRVGGRDQPTPSARRAPPKVLSFAELMQVERPKVRMIFDGYPLPAQGATLIVGAPKAGKTILALQQGLALARGRHLFDNYTLLPPDGGREAASRGAVMVIEQDDPAGDASIREIAELSGGGALDTPFHVVPRVEFGLGPALLDWLEGEIVSRQLRMVILDSYTTLRGEHQPGCDIVKVEQTELSTLNALGLRLKCAIGIVHHDSVTGATRDWTRSAAGTFAMLLAVEAMIHITRFEEFDGMAPERLVRIRARHGGDLYAVLRFRERTLDYEHVLESGAADLYPLIRQIQDDFKGEVFGPKELTHATGFSLMTANRRIQRMRQAGVIQKRAFGEYVLSVKV